MAFTFFQPLFDKVDAATATFITDVSSRAIAAVTPYVTAGLALSFVVQGLAIMRGSIQEPLTAFVQRMFFVSVVLAVGLAGGLYQTDLIYFIRDIPDDLATALASNNAKGAGNLLDAAAESGFKVGAEAAAQGGIFTAQGVMYYLLSVIIMVCTALLMAIGGAILMLVKVAVSLLAAVGPLFIMALLFEPTRRLFTNWVSQTLGYVVLISMFSVCFGFAMNMFRDFAQQVKIEPGSNVIYSIGALIIMAVSVGYLLWHLPAITSKLAEGISLEPRRIGKNKRAQSASAANQATAEGSSPHESGSHSASSPQAPQGANRGSSGAPQARGYAQGASRAKQQKYG